MGRTQAKRKGVRSVGPLVLEGITEETGGLVKVATEDGNPADQIA